MSWKLKVDPEKKSPVIEDDGRIIYIDPEGKELGLNPPALFEKIGELGKENKKHREKYSELKKKYSILEGIEDIAEYKQKADEALKTVENFNDKDYLKADKVDKLKADITAAYEEKIKQLGSIYGEKEAELSKQVEAKADQIRRLLISKHFATSKYFSGGEKSKTILPSAIAEDHFGKHFKIEDGPDGLPTIRAFYSNGDQVLSRNNPGEPADFDEAIGLIIDKYPGKESILRSTASGSGSTGGTGNNATLSDIEQIKKGISEAYKNNNIQQAIVLKNRLHAIQKVQSG